MVKITEIKVKKFSSGNITAEKSKYVVLPEDIYVGKYLGYELRNKEDDYFYIHKWGVDFDEEEVTITEISSVKLTENTKLGKIIKSLGIEIIEDKDYSLDSLIGKKCKIVVIKEENKGKEINRITEHLRV